MNITNIMVNKSKNSEDRLKGVARIILDNMFMVRNIKIIEKQNSEIFLAMPSRKTKSESFQDVFHPINQEARAFIEKAVLYAFDELNTSGKKYISMKMNNAVSENKYEFNPQDYTIEMLDTLEFVDASANSISQE